MSSTIFTAFIALTLAFASPPANSGSKSRCPVTSGSHEAFSEAWPQSLTWFGSDSLATILPDDGIWSTTRPGGRISVKVFWWSAGFEAGMESNLSVKVEGLEGSSSRARIDRPTSAYTADLGATTMLTGIHFPDPGCWRISAEYSGQKLTFIVETIDFEEYRNKYL